MGHVQTPSTEFWAILTPLPHVGNFTKKLLSSVVVIWATPLPLVCPRGLYTPPNMAFDGNFSVIDIFCNFLFTKKCDFHKTHFIQKKVSLSGEI